MFHVNEACKGKGTLTVENGQMTIHISLPSSLGVGDVQRLDVGNLAEARDLAVDGEVGSLEHGLPGIVVAARTPSPRLPTAFTPRISAPTAACST